MAYLAAQGWDCYPEAECAGGRPDIVAVRPFPFQTHRQCVHIVECKTSWTLTLLEQSVRRLAYAHYVTIAAPTVPRPYFRTLCRREGIGMLTFDPAVLKYRRELSIEEPGCEPARLQRHRDERFFGPKRVLDLLDDDMKRYAPGTTAAQGYSTPWRRTMDRAAAYIAENPGTTVKELVAQIDHHYSRDSGAKQGFLLWLGKRGDVEARLEGGAMRFYAPGARSVMPRLPLDEVGSV